MDLKVDINQLICPITQFIIKDPVIAEDGIVYEKDAITEWLSKNDTSPMTRKKISKKLVDCMVIKNLISDLIKLHPDLADRQYAYSIEEIIKTKKYVELRKHKNIDLKYLMDKNALHTLLKNTDAETVKHIIDNATDLHCSSKHGSLMIHYVCQSSPVEIVDYLIKKDPSVNLDSENNDKLRPIHYACDDNPNNDVVKYLLDKGVNTECPDENGRLPIHIASKRDKVDIVGWLVDKGVNMGCPDKDGFHPIHIACKYKSNNVVKYLVERGVNLESETNKKSKPIHIACRYNNLDAMITLIDKNVNLENQNIDGLKPIHFVCRYGNVDGLKLLIEKGIDLECSTADGLKPIHIACKYKNFDALKILADNGVNLESETNDGWRPIHVACKYGTHDMIRYLFSKGVDINCRIKKYDGSTVDYDIIKLIKLNETI
jgi:ankyrin